MGINSSAPLGDFIRLWMDKYKAFEVKPSTFMRLEVSLSTLQHNAISNMPIEDITALNIEQYLTELVNARYSFSTIKKQKELITASLKAAYKLGYIASNRIADVSLPKRYTVKRRTKLVQAYTNAEQARLRAVLATYKRPGYALTDLLFETGMRVGEALALNWDSVMWDRRRIWVHATVVNPLSKGSAYVQEGAKSVSSNREILLSDKALRILGMLNEQSMDEWIFAGRDGERLTYEALVYQVKAACREANVPYRGMHCFRHCFATNMYHRGLDIKKLSMLLGHASTAITYDIYIHPNEDDDEGILNIMN
jgi:integrase